MREGAGVIAPRDICRFGNERRHTLRERIVFRCRGGAAVELGVSSTLECLSSLSL